MIKGKLYLIPIPISEDSLAVIPEQVIETLKPLEHFLVEDIRTARRYLSSLKIFQSIESLHFQVLNKDTKESELSELLKPLEEGNSIGVISESGCPGIADPGALAAKHAHQNNIVVVPLVGPSSILLALMASGLNSVFDHFIRNLHSDTLLTIAIDITGKTESIKTKKIRYWKNEKVTWPKSPAVFLFLA